MPQVSAANLTRLRTTKHATLLRLAVYTPATIWTARVNGAQTTGSITITVDGVVQVRAPGQHYQVWIGSTDGGNEYGETYFEDYAAPTLTVAPHNCELPDDAYITVKEEIKPQAINHSMDASDVVLEGGITPYVDQNVDYIPAARCGPPAVAYRDPTTGIATVYFYGNPAAVATGATITDHAWDFGADSNPATSAIQGTSAVPIEVEYSSAGQRYISYWVQDSNGKTHSTRRPVFIFDRYSGTLPYRQVAVQGLSGDVGAGGWTCRLTVWTSAAPSAFPAGAMIVLFAEDWYGAEKLSIGGQYTYRENIVFVGYIRRGTIKKDWAKGAVEFDADGLGVLAGNLPGMAFTLTSDATPVGWHELSGMTPTFASFHILTEHSTFDHIADYALTLQVYGKNFIDIMDSSIRDQIGNQIVACARGRFGSSAQGLLYCESNPQLLPLASRTAAMTLQTTFADMREMDIGPEEYEKRAALVEFSGEEADGTPKNSLAPAFAYRSGGQWLKVDGIRVDTQAESNIVAGLFEGEANNNYNEIAIQWRGNYRVFDVFPAEATYLNITAVQNARGIVFTNERTWTKRVNYEYKNTHLLVSSVHEADAYGAPGITGEYPEEPPELIIPPIDTQPPVVDPQPPEDYPDGDEAGDWRSRVYIATVSRGIYYSGDFTGPGGAMPTWTTVNTGLPSLAIRGFTADPFQPSNRQYAIFNDVVGAAGGKSTSIYHRVGGGAWSELMNRTDFAAIAGCAPNASDGILALFTNINSVGWLGCVALVLNSGSQLRFFKSTDYGANWTMSATVLNVNVNPNCYHAGAGLFKGASPFAAGQVVYIVGLSIGALDDVVLWVSTNGGTTFSVPAIYEGVYDFEGDFLQLDPCQDTTYFGVSKIRSTNRGVSYSAFLPAGCTVSIAGVSAPAARGYKLMPTYDPSANPAATTVRAVDIQNDIWKTINGGTNWTEIAHGTLFCAGNIGILVYQDAEGKLYGISTSAMVAATEHAVGVTVDEGVTWEGKAGADRTSGTVNGIPYDCGGVVGILPVYA